MTEEQHPEETLEHGIRAFAGAASTSTAEGVNSRRPQMSAMIQESPSADAQHVEVSVALLPDLEKTTRHFGVHQDALLLDVLDEGARKLEVKLLPGPRDPLDHLRGVYDDAKIGMPLDRKLTLAEFLKQPDATSRFAIELVLAIQINTRWRVAPSQQMDPRAILILAGLSPQEYSLYYPPESVDPLPPDKPIELHRGERFEAQRDGKYGEGTPA